jgi:hypothetical protein
VKCGRKVTKDDSNRSGKCSDKNCDDTVSDNADANSNGDKVVKSKNPTKRLVTKSKRKVEK